mmetsp:Transcript_56412/g.127286  ORF Transcript_56412/g.127286 Transcript_56412/m.127286 type:complete len:401 (-) Transcript_56412:2-1204(-)
METRPGSGMAGPATRALWPRRRTGTRRSTTASLCRTSASRARTSTTSSSSPTGAASRMTAPSSRLTSRRSVLDGARSSPESTTRRRSWLRSRCRSGQRRRSPTMSSMLAAAFGAVLEATVAPRPSSARTQASGSTYLKTSTRGTAWTVSSGSACSGTRTTGARGTWQAGTRRSATRGAVRGAPAAGCCLRSTTGPLSDTLASSWSTTSSTPAPSTPKRCATLPRTSPWTTAALPGQSLRRPARSTSSSCGRRRWPGWMGSSRSPPPTGRLWSRTLRPGRGPGTGSTWLARTGLTSSFQATSTRRSCTTSTTSSRSSRTGGATSTPTSWHPRPGSCPEGAAAARPSKTRTASGPFSLASSTSRSTTRRSRQRSSRATASCGSRRSSGSVFRQCPIRSTTGS